MFQQRPVFCFIAARGGSKGLPRKNILKINEKPLIVHTIDIAKKVKYFDKIYVSTEDPKIKKISFQAGALVINRPQKLATDSSTHIEVVQHFLHSIKETNPIIVLMNPTSPIRRIKDIEKCIEMFDEKTNIVISVKEVKEHPARMFRKKRNYLQFYLDTPPKSNRQEFETLFIMNGSVFVTDAKFIKTRKSNFFGGRMKSFVMDEKHSMNIDTRSDFEICKYFMEKRKKN